MNKSILGKINKALTIDNYKSELNFKKTINAINFINNNFYKKMDKNFNIVKVPSPGIFDDSLNINDEVNDCVFTKDILISQKSKIGIIPNGIKKWLRITSNNIGLNNDELLFVENTSLNANLYNNSSEPVFFNKVNLLFPCTDNNVSSVLNERFEIIIKILIDLLNETQKLYKIKKREFASIIKFKKINEAEFYSNESYIDAISNIFETEKEIVVMNTIPEKNLNKNLIFPYDIYNWKYYLSAFVENIYNSDIYKLLEVSYDCDYESLSNQRQIIKQGEDFSENYYTNIIKDNKLKSNIQISINMTYLYMIALNKIHISEVVSTILSDKELEIIKKNKIKIL